MTVRLYPPIAHEHGDLRQELAALAKVLSNASCPPAGHAFHGILQASGEYFERELPEPRQMRGTLEDERYAERISAGTVGLRLTPTRIVAKQKMSQNRPDHIVDSIMTELGGDSPYASDALLREMRIVHDRRRAAR